MTSERDDNITSSDDRDGESAADRAERLAEATVGVENPTNEQNLDALVRAGGRSGRAVADAGSGGTKPAPKGGTLGAGGAGAGDTAVERADALADQAAVDALAAAQRAEAAAAAADAARDAADAAAAEAEDWEAARERVAAEDGTDTGDAGDGETVDETVSDDDADAIAQLVEDNDRDGLLQIAEDERVDVSPSANKTQLATAIVRARRQDGVE